MVGERPEQAILTKNTDLSKTEETKNVIESMIDGLNDHRIDDIGEFFSKHFLRKYMLNKIFQVFHQLFVEGHFLH